VIKDFRSSYMNYYNNAISSVDAILFGSISKGIESPLVYDVHAKICNYLIEENYIELKNTGLLS